MPALCYPVTVAGKVRYKYRRCGVCGKRARPHRFTYRCRACDRAYEKTRNRDQRGVYARLSVQGTLFRSAKARAKRKGLAFTLRQADIVVPLACPVLGILLQRGTRQNRGSAPSLDRINPREGYVPGNVVVVSWRANNLKRDALPSELRKVALFYSRLERL